MHKKIRKAVFPVGGLGTRFLPATKSMPKEMLPIVDKPLIHYAFEEARAAGIEEFIFITGRNKNAISNHFDHAYELQTMLGEKNKQEELEKAKSWLPPAGSIVFTRQQDPLGLGHAVWCARKLVGDEPFAVILADDLVQADVPCMRQMVEMHADVGGNLLAVEDIPIDQTMHYGIFDIDNRESYSTDKRLVKAKGLVEKPAPGKAPSTLSIIGRYILQPDIFAVLERQQPGFGGEIQLTDSINRLVATQAVHGLRFEGRRYDCGSRVGYVTANLAYALAHADMRPRMLETMQQLLKEAGHGV